MIKITNIKIKADLSDDELFEKIYKKYKINKNDVTERRIIKKSIDARNKADIFYNYSVELECKNENKIKNVQIVKKEEPFKIIVNRKSSKRPVIIGAGPAGLFSALTLAQNGIKPIIIEQGKTVDERKKDVEEFLNEFLNRISTYLLTLTSGNDKYEKVISNLSECDDNKCIINVP